MLYSKERHQYGAAINWDAQTARREITDIVSDAESAFQSSTWWPQHPRDDHPLHSPANKTLYLGAAGVMWALEFLAEHQAITLSRSYSKLWYKAWQDYRSRPDTGEEVPSWFVGQSALLLLCMLRGPQNERSVAADRLYEAVAANIENPTWEILWGSPGTMLAALFAYEKTAASRWLELYQRSVDRLWDAWTYNEDLGCYVWTQDLYGKKDVIYGAGHGFAGNAFSLLRGMKTFSEDRRRLLISRVATTTKRLAIRSNSFANWPVSRKAFSPSEPSAKFLQWCHGGPGYLLTLGPHITLGQDMELDQLFLEAGELIWHAGPLAKGACFCHGTDGNAMALLTLFKRTGDEKWLDRGRSLAMQALQQSRENLKVYGRRRYSLWTGDLGLAILLQASIDGRPHMPALDFI